MNHKHFENSLTLKPVEKQEIKKCFKLILHSDDIDSGTDDYAKFYIDIKDVSLFDEHAKYSMVVESFVVQNTVVTTLVNKLYYVRIPNITKSYCYNKNSIKDIVATVYGNSYFNSSAPNITSGSVVVDKSFLQNNYMTVYFTHGPGPYSAINSLTEFNDVNTFWTLTLSFIEI
jgi:hypothetical protein